MKQRNYYNTTELDSVELNKAISNATTQDKIILKWFKDNPNKEVTAEDIWINLFDVSSVPITSIRRSLNTLRDKRGKIVNVFDDEGRKKKKRGTEFGKLILIWRLK